jgi:hypothetical protein
MHLAFEFAVLTHPTVMSEFVMANTATDIGSPHVSNSGLTRHQLATKLLRFGAPRRELRNFLTLVGV